MTSRNAIEQKNFKLIGMIQDISENSLFNVSYDAYSNIFALLVDYEQDPVKKLYLQEKAIFYEKISNFVISHSQKII